MTRIQKGLRPLCLVVLALLAAAPACSAADFTARPSPPAFVAEFAASGSAWVTVTDGFPLQAFVSRDGSRTWQEVPINGTTQAQSVGGLSVGPDGAFYMSLRDQNGLGLVRMARDGSSFERIPALLPTEFDAYAGAPAWDQARRMWIGIIDSGRLTVERLLADGSPADAVSTQVDTSASPALEFAGGKLYADVSAGVYQLAAGVLRQISGSGTSAFGSNWPVLVVGRTILTEAGISLDGGATFGSRVGADLIAVHESDKLLVARGYAGSEGGRVMTRWSPSVFRPSGLTVPQGTGELWQTSHGLVAFSAGGSGAIAVHEGAVPGLQIDSRGLSGVARSMLSRADYYRRKVGLPPLIGDRLISKATLNHARYWYGRALPRGHLLDVHSETPHTRGFTGTTPQERCRHVGGDCGGEVMNFGNQAQHPVDSWVATPYHRQPFIDPGIVAAGAARVGRIAVMDFSFQPQNLVLAPVRFPIGSYSGSLVFPGNEAPDPLAACRGVHQPLGPRPSVPVSFVPPVAVARTPVVELFRGRARVPGCTKVGFFMGRSPLQPHTRYAAKATWQPAGGGPNVTTVWTFKTS